MSAVPSVPLAWLVDLVNKYGHRPRAAAGETAAPYPTLVEHTPSTAATLRLPELIELADRLWPVFNRHEPARQTAALNTLLNSAELAPSVTAEGVLQWTSTHRDKGALTAAGCAVALLAAVRDGGWKQLGVCDGVDCVDVHVHDRGRRRRYCSTICLNRARVRAYRSRN